MTCRWCDGTGIPTDECGDHDESWAGVPGYECDACGGTGKARLVEYDNSPRMDELFWIEKEESVS